jgi:hypothetical protein
MGNNNPVDGFPPKIIASDGTTNIETLGTPTFDIPTSIAQKITTIQPATERSKENILFIFRAMANVVKNDTEQISRRLTGFEQKQKLKLCLEIKHIGSK